jgi:hypothetical protein
MATIGVIFVRAIFIFRIIIGHIYAVDTGITIGAEFVLVNQELSIESLEGYIVR